MSPHRKRRKLSGGSFEAIEELQNSTPIADSKAEKDPRRSLFVRSLPSSVTTERLAEYFSQSFPVKHATVVVDPTTKISKGYGFVTFTDADEAHAAVAQLNNSAIDGRKIKVEIAESRHRDIEDGGKKGVNTTAERLKAEREGQKRDSQPPRLIVRNLPWNIKEAEDLAKLFQSYGKIKHAVVPKRSPKAQYGFGIVILRGKKNAERALAGVNGKEIDGRVLAVDWAVDKKTWELAQHDEAEREALEQAPEQLREIPHPNGLGEALPYGSDRIESSESDIAASHEQPGAVIDSDEAADDISREVDKGSVDSGSEASSSVSHGGDQPDQNNTTIFIRNLPYEVEDDALKEHFQAFGAVRYARVVYDQETERSRGTAFVCFFSESDARSCVKSAPKKELPKTFGTDVKRRGDVMAHSVLQNDAEDPTGRYTLEGRVLQVSRALSKSDADRRADEASGKRLKRDRDKRRLYLLSEGTIPQSSKLYHRLGKAEIDIRESSARQRQKLIKSNPNLCLSLTRLSVRNIPRHVNSRDLKALARDAIVGFSKDVNDGIREALSKEELRRGGEAMKEAERRRKEKGVGVVRQAKIVFEGREGGKVKEGGGRSRGYGFIEYYTHRNALAGLRWLNGHLVKPKDGSGENAKRLIVEFAIENAQVVQRRNDREKQAVERGTKKRLITGGDNAKPTPNGRKRKRPSEEKIEASKSVPDQDDKNRTAKRNRIIAKKRAMRKARKG